MLNWHDLWLEEARRLPLQERQALLYGNYKPIAYELLSNEELKTKRDGARHCHNFDTHKETCIEINKRKKLGVWE